MIKRYRWRHRLDRGMKGWIVNYSRRNYWRVSSPCFDLEDLIQEGYICYCRCLDKYGHLLEQRHFMALLKITFMNHINQLSEGKTSFYSPTRAKFADTPISDYASGETALEDLAPMVPEESSFLTLVNQLPAELKDLVKTLLNDAQVPMEEGETINEWLCRIAGLPAKRCNVEDMLKRHFGLLDSKPIPKGKRALIYVGGELNGKAI